MLPCELVGVGQRHQEPTLGTQPDRRALARDGVGPLHPAGAVVGVAVKAQLLIPQQGVGGLELVEDVVPVFFAILFQTGGVEGHSHIKAVQPDLIGINILVPEIPGHSAGVIVQNVIRPLHALGPARLSGGLPEHPHGFAEAHLVDVVLADHPVGHGAVHLHEPAGIFLHRLQPAFVARGMIQVVCTYYTQVVLIIPRLFFQETRKYVFQILFKIFQPHPYHLLYSPAKSATRFRISTASARLTSLSGPKQPFSSSSIKPK